MRKIPTILAVVLVLLALVAAAAFEAARGAWSGDDVLARAGVAHDAAVVAPADGLYDGGGGVLVRRDHWGFRGSGTDPARIGILTVGGDAVSQLFLPDDATWQAAMQHELQAKGHPAVIANAGVEGQTTVGHVRAMADWFVHVPGLKPQFIIFMVGQNDALTGGAPSAADVPVVTADDGWRRRSALWRLARRALGRAAAAPAAVPAPARVDFAAQSWTDTARQPDWHLDGALAEAYQERLRVLAQASHAMGAVPVFVTQSRADFRQEDGAVTGVAATDADGLNGIDRFRRLAAFNRATRQVCADEGLLCLDLAREVTFEPGDFYDYLHNTPQGAARIGRWLATKLAGLV